MNFTQFLDGKYLMPAREPLINLYLVLPLILSHINIINASYDAIYMQACMLHHK